MKNKKYKLGTFIILCLFSFINHSYVAQDSEGDQAIDVIIRTESVDLGMSRPALSPDGKQIAFEWMSSIWTVAVEGGEAVRVSDWSERCYSPEWSPDGKYIACIRTDKEVRAFAIRLYELGSENRGIELWRTQLEIKPSLDWSPDGKRIVFSTGHDQMISFLTLGEEKPNPLELFGMCPCWSPDGKSLAFQKADNHDLWIVSTQDWEKRRLASTVSFNAAFCWSPEGKEIVYESLDRESVDLWRIDAAGGKATPLTNDIASEQTPCWHPTNDHIYFSHRRRIWRVPSEGGEMELVPIKCHSPKKASDQVLMAFKGADIVDVKNGKLIQNQTILVKDGRIEKVGSDICVPPEAEIIDVHGLTAVPGLIDMHVHYHPWMGPYFLRYGVTRIQELGCGGGLDAILSLKEEIKAGISPGPLLYICGMLFNGSGIAGPPGSAGVQSANPAVIRKALEWHIGEGIDVVKLGSENTKEVLRAIIEVAHASNRRVIGHIALVPIDEAIKMGQDGIEHPRGVGWGIVPSEQRPEPVPRRLQGMLREAAAWWNPDPARMSAVVDLMVRNEVVWNPTLYIWILSSNSEGLKAEPEYEGLPEWIKSANEAEDQYSFEKTWLKSDYEAYGAGIPNMRKMVGEFHKKGGLVTAGSDGGIPGKSLHQELEQLLLSGLSPTDCIRAVTLNAARALRLESEIGSVEPGKKGDIVFVQGDPLQDIKVLRRVELTVQEGRVVYQMKSSSSLPQP